MTARTAFVSGLLLVATAWPLPSDAQRARVRSADAEETNRTAVPRATADRPEPAPAPAPAPAVPPPAPAVPPPATETPARTARERPPAPVVVSPTVSAPTDVGGAFSVGTPVVVGREFTVGGSREDRDRRDDRERRRPRRGDDDDETVLVPVYVPVIVPESDVTTTPTYLEPEAAGATAATRAVARSSFLPWFQVGWGLMAGVPSALPAPDTFDERNVSASVSETLAGSERASSAYAPGTGGVSFDLVPADAAVFVDGAFVGSAGDFAPGREPLLLRFGAYAFELRARGYRTEAFRLDVRMGEVLPIAGALEKMPQ